MNSFSSNIIFNDSFNKIVIPSYQRAYAWKKKQIQQFVNDLMEIGDKQYYYGHFIAEINQKKLEIIDGQQRITTFILFLLSAKLYSDVDLSEYEELIKEKFETIDYDKERFSELVESAFENKLIELKEADTASFRRIVDAIEVFKELFESKKIGDNEIKQFINTLLKAQVSIHTTSDKKVAVQIFELQNSRGIQLDLIEKVKAKLMKEIYLNTPKEVSEQAIIKLQQYFAEIYQFEEQTEGSSFRGNLTLDNILLHHLRVIDDGHKTDGKNFHSPSLSNNIEENVLKYIDDKINESDDKQTYIMLLAERFLQSVRFVCIDLVERDTKNHLIGDCLILDRNYSIELYLILLHNNKFDDIDLKKWELFLYTRDFHDKYYKKTNRDNFQWLFERLFNENVNDVIDNFVNLGFRRELFKDDLQGVFNNYIEIHKNDILTNAFWFWKEKMTYLLYKYEIENDKENPSQIRKDLRVIFKKGKALEHILPQSWKIDWIDDIEKEKKREELTQIINGIGNLLLITHSENSSQSDTHPKEKTYQVSNFGSYQEHEDNKHRWADYKEWNKIIDERGNKMYEFLLSYFS